MQRRMFGSGHWFRYVKHWSLLMVIVLAGLLIPGVPVTAQVDGPATLVRDLDQLPAANPTPGSISWVTGTSDRIFFATLENQRVLLWAGDGTVAGTTAVRDLTPAMDDVLSLSIMSMIGVGSQLFFVSGPSGTFWRSDGTPAGTYPLMQAVGTYELLALGAHVLVSAYHNEQVGIWKSDGTAGGASLLLPITPGINNNPRWLAVAGDQAFFLYDDGSSGPELWVTAGSAATTRLVREIGPQSAGIAVQSYAAVGSILYLSIDGKLWRSDGTADGTYQVAPDVSEVQDLVQAEGTLFFHGVRMVDSVTRATGLWQSGGTDATTTEVLAFDTSTYQTVAPSWLRPAGAGVLFLGPNNVLWASDGSAANTVEIPGVQVNWPHTESTEFNGMLYFAATLNDSMGLWKSDGTHSGTVRVTANADQDVAPPSSMTTANGKLYFVGSLDGTAGYGLWQSDGSAAGTILLRDAALPRGSFVPQQEFVVAGPYGFFNFYDGVSTSMLWRSDGSEAGTLNLKTWETAGWIDAWTSLHNRLAFFRYEQESGRTTLWLSDGTSAGTVPLTQLPAESRSLEGKVLMGGYLYFIANNRDLLSAQLWRSDGTANGTTKVRDVGYLSSLAGSPFAPKRWLTTMGNRLFFVNSDSTHGRELWISDGTDGGTRLLKDLTPGETGTAINGLTAAGGLLYFLVDSDNLWRSDGTAEGTYQIADAGSRYFTLPVELTAVGNRVFFNGYDDEAGEELWVSDGTAAGTRRVKDINSLRSSSLIGDLVAANGTLIFSADDGVHGRELWRSDGTEQGTTLIKDINAADNLPDEFAGSWVRDLAVVSFDGWVLFAASNGQDGIELWKTKGSAESTVQVQNIAPGAQSSLPAGFAALGEQILFSADDGIHGRELWSIPLDALIEQPYQQIYLPLIQR